MLISYPVLDFASLPETLHIQTTSNAIDCRSIVHLLLGDYSLGYIPFPFVPTMLLFLLCLSKAPLCGPFAYFLLILDA